MALPDDSMQHLFSICSASVFDPNLNMLLMKLLTIQLRGQKLPLGVGCHLDIVPKTFITQPHRHHFYLAHAMLH